VASSGLAACVVTNAEGIVFGLLRGEELDAPDETRAEDVMLRAPSTFRPNVPLSEMAEYMAKHELESAPITSSDGRLIGLLTRRDAE
jgi:CBS domain-containing protein